MEIAAKKGEIGNAPKRYVRIRITEEAKGTRRLVREDGIETLEIGAGKFEKLNRRTFILLCRSVIRAAHTNKSKHLAIQFDQTPKLFKNLKAYTREDLAQLTAENFEMANFDFNHFKTKPEKGWDAVEEILIYGKSSREVERAVQKGQEIGRAVNACRTLANTPGGDITPTTLAKAAKEAVKGLPVKVTVLGEKEMQKLGMGALLGVAK
jgi:leucyl aminopeptidase